jgi:phospholipid/cholesterol/gamma-HCH transport system substrate-binding protein
LQTLGQSLPTLIDAMTAVIRKIELFLDDVSDQHIPTHLVSAIDGVNGVASDLQTLVKHVDRAKLPDKTASALDSLTEAVTRVNGLLAGMGGDGGLVASTQRASDSIGDLGRSANRSTDQLERTLRDLDEAAAAVRDLADAIERDPDMLVKGRAKGKPRE